MSASRTPLDLAMTERSLHVRKRWVDIAREAAITTSALSAIRRGEYRPSAHTARALEDALRWEHGSIDAILAGGEPTLPGDRRSHPGTTGPGDDELLDADADDDGLQDLVNRARRERDGGDDTLYRMLLRLQGMTEPPQESGRRADETPGGKQQAS